ncbi:uncharacterized protein [Typha angustifolia]|uniref:uncharacterized protein n=1 Tax=Typha angustifolia TaxID=59011 RepID=UPI003C301C34
MADEGNEGRSRRMDLNLYLGLPRSPRPRSLDLGSDLALSSLPMSDAEDSRALSDASVAAVNEPAESHPPYSPSHASYTPELPAVSVNSLPPADSVPNPEYTPYYPSYEPYGASYPTIPPNMPEQEGPDAPYSPVDVHALQVVQEIDEAVIQDIGPLLQYGSTSPPRLDDEPAALGGETQMPYSPPYVPVTSTYSPPYIPATPPYIPASTTPEVRDEIAFSFYPSLPIHSGEFLDRDDGSSSRRELLRSPELRFRRLIESSSRLRARRFRSSLAYGGERSNLGSPSRSSPQQLMHELVTPQRSAECSRMDKVPVEAAAAEASEEESDEKSRSAANFECNICFDMATEPVVTSCGHLFCWPCLYQWLHVHSDHKECPVCKGEVTDSNIVPIYGRGGLETSAENKLGEGEESGLKIPPRPRGSRIESLRQQFRPISRRLGEGIATSWRRLLDQQRRNVSRIEGHADPALQEVLDGAHRRALTRLRARRMQREEGNPDIGSITGEIGLPRNNMLNPLDGNSNSLFRDGIDLWHRFSLYGLASTERLAAITADLGRVVGRFATSNNHYGASSSSANPPNSEPGISGSHVGAALAADQASASSTMAVIHEDVAISDNPAEPNSAGSSRSHRRRGRSSTSGSLDVDGGALHARKRRRLN